MEPLTTPHHKSRQIRSVRGVRMVLSLPLPYLSMWFVRKKMLKYQRVDTSVLNQLKQAYATWIPLPTWSYLTCLYLAHVLILVIYSSIYLDKRPIVACDGDLAISRLLP
jgi:uncharacterized membrane protein YhdT